MLKRARIHPLAVLIAEKVYAQGKGEKGSLTWKPLAKIVDALDAAFYATFQNVEPCGKPVLLALDSAVRWEVVRWRVRASLRVKPAQRWHW